MLNAESAAAFRSLHDAAQPLLLPNAWDYASAAVLVAAGFPVVGTTSLGVAAANGLPDAEGQARAETLALARRLGLLPCLFTVDIEAGFSDDPVEVADLAAELAEAGAVGVNLEDGRAGATLADSGRQVELIQAVKERVPRLFLNARVDTYWLAAEASLSATLARAQRYSDAGADGIFVPGLVEDEHIRVVVASVAEPVNILFSPRHHTLGSLTALGVRRVSTGSLLFRTAVHSALVTAEAIRAGEPITADVLGYAEIQQLVGRARS